MTELWTDISRFQASPDFGAMRRGGVAGVILNVEDPDWLAKAEGAHAAGLAVGLYQWLHSGNDPVSDARHLLACRDQAVAAGIPVVALAIDHEEGVGDQVPRTLLAMRTVIAGAKGATPLYYSGGWFTTQHIAPFVDQHGVAAEVSAWCLWDAAYTASEPAPPYPWTHITVWQFTSTGRVPGVAGNVDEDRVFSTLGMTPQTPAQVGIPSTGGGPAPNHFTGDDMTGPMASALVKLFYLTAANAAAEKGHTVDMQKWINVDSDPRTAGDFANQVKALVGGADPHAIENSILVALTK